MSSTYPGGGAFYDRIMARVSIYSPEEVASFKTTIRGAEPEDRFTQLARDSVGAGDTVVDLGTGAAAWLLSEVAPRGRLAVGLDESRLSLIKAVQAAQGRPGVAFLQSDARNIPLGDGTANLVLSRRGPLTAGSEFLREACRILAPSSLTLEIAIGEQNAREVTEVFGRSQMSEDARRGPRLARLEARYRAAGLELILGEDSCQPEYFPSREALQYRLLTTPILPDYDPDAHAADFDQLVGRFTTDEGIMLTYHRLITMTRKPA